MIECLRAFQPGGWLARSFFNTGDQMETGKGSKRIEQCRGRQYILDSVHTADVNISEGHKEHAVANLINAVDYLVDLVEAVFDSIEDAEVREAVRSKLLPLRFERGGIKEQTMRELPGEP